MTGCSARAASPKTATKQAEYIPIRRHPNVPEKPKRASWLWSLAAKPEIRTPCLFAFGLQHVGVEVEDGTPLKLRISQTVSSADAHVGQTVDFEVLEEVKVNDIVVVPKGGYALATVTEAQAKRRMGRGGKLNINIDHVRLADGEKAALRAVKDVKGGGHVGAMTGAIVATSIVFFPAAPLFLFMHGKDITIPKGTEITAFVNGNLPLDLAHFLTQKAVNADAGTATVQSPAETASAQNGNSTGVLSTVELKSTPDGAEI